MHILNENTIFHMKINKFRTKCDKSEVDGLGQPLADIHQKETVLNKPKIEKNKLHYIMVQIFQGVACATLFYKHLTIILLKTVSEIAKSLR